MEGHHFVFIGGLHRSGTTVLCRCLQEHPLISGFRNTGAPEDEGQHLQTVYRPAKVYGGAGLFGFNPAAHLTETSDLVSDTHRLQLFRDWERYWDLNKPVLLEKSPPNLIRTRFLQALFPKSSFIIVTRHPMAVALATQKWSGTSLPHLIEHWLTCHETFEQDRPHLRRVMVVRYEELAACSQAVLSQIYSFLGLPAHPNRSEIRSGINERYITQWREYQEDPTQDTRILAARIRSEYIDRAARFGYHLNE